MLTRTDDTLIISTGAVSRAWLKRLPADLRRMVVEEGNKLQERATAYSHVNENFMIDKWKKAGGTLITLPAGDLAEIRNRLSSVGNDVTKGNPSLSAFYKKIVATGRNY